MHARAPSRLFGGDAARRVGLLDRAQRLSPRLGGAFVAPVRAPPRRALRTLPTCAAGPRTHARRAHPRAAPPRPAVVMADGTPALGTPRARLHSLPDGHVRVVCVGDVHGMWTQTDEDALAALGPSLVVFVGDYGNEDVDVVRRVAEVGKAMDVSVVAALGNHDGFFSMSDRGRRLCPYNAHILDRVQEQLDLLSAINPAYRSIDVDGDVPLSVVGGRPFTWGGPLWKCNEFYRKYFGVLSMQHSEETIAKAGESATHDSTLFVSHNGPTGLGRLPTDPCGKDFGEAPGGDFGDADLRGGIEATRKAGKAVSLVVFGHMHHTLFQGGFRKMLATEKDGATGEETVMLNAAVVPRHRRRPGFDETLSQFTVVELGPNKYVSTVEQVWVTSEGEVVEAEVLLDKTRADCEAARVGSLCSE